jgi:hypothetical protein
MPRFWTLEDAQAALPDAIALLRELQSAARKLSGEAASGGAQAVPAAVALHSPSVNGHGRPEPAETPEQRARRLLRELEQRGILVKDVRSGLIDFPYLRGGVEVLLCFRLGEAAIAYWHELDTGFAGRHPLAEL